MPANPLFATTVTGPHRAARVAALSAAVFERPFLPWQHQAASLITERGADDLPKHSVVVILVQRQAGKTAEMQPVILDTALFAGPSRRIWYTAQSGKYAKDFWSDFVQTVAAERSPLAGHVAAKWSQGSEVATFPNGSTFSPFPPTRDALHGKQSDLVIVDEAWRHDAAKGAELEQAIIPTMATRPGAQLVIVSAAGTADSVWLRKWVDAGRAGSVAYLEYGIGDDGDPSDVDAVIAAHPAAGVTITEQFIRQQAELLPAGEFARAFGNAWTRTLERTIDAELWTARATDDTIPDDAAPVFAADVAQDGSRSAILAAAGGVIEVIDSAPGVDWLAGRLVQLAEDHRPPPLGIPSRGPAAPIADAVRAAGVDVADWTLAEEAAASARWLTDLTVGAVRYRHHPALSLAVADAARRNVGDGWVFGRRPSAGPIPELIAGVMAHWLDLHRPPAEVAPAFYFATG